MIRRAPTFVLRVAAWTPFVVLGAVGAERPADAADAASSDVAACATAADRGQAARDRVELKAARDQFVRCAAATCPAIVRNDCVRWLDDVERRTPTVTFFADVGGRDVTDVRVSVDGVEVAARLDGRSVPVDPGEHKVRFARQGGAVEERALLFVEGEKNRKIEVHFAGAPAPAAATSPVGGGEPSATSSRWGAWPWIAASVGVVGVAGFTAFGLSGRAKLSDLDKCAPRCEPADVDRARTAYLVADVSLGIAVVGLGVATILFLTNERRAPTGEASAYGAR